METDKPGDTLLRLLNMKRTKQPSSRHGCCNLWVVGGRATKDVTSSSQPVGTFSPCPHISIPIHCKKAEMRLENPLKQDQVKPDEYFRKVQRELRGYTAINCPFFVPDLGNTL